MKNKIITLSKGNNAKSTWYYGNYGTSWKAKGSVKDRKIAPMLKISVTGNENDPNSNNDTVTVKYQRGFTFYNQNCTTKITTSLSFSCSDDTSFSKPTQIQDFVYKYNSQDKNLRPHQVQFKESNSETNPETSFTIKREFGKEKICELKMLVSRNGKNDSQLCIRIPICEKKQKVTITDNKKYTKVFFLGKEDGINFQKLLNDSAKQVTCTYNSKVYSNYSPGTSPLNSGKPLTFTISSKTVSNGNYIYNINFKASYSKDVPFSYSIISTSENPSLKDYLSKLEPVKTGYTFIGWTLNNERLVEEPENGYSFNIVNFNNNETFTDLNKGINFSSTPPEATFSNLKILDINNTTVNSLFAALGSDRDENKVELDGKTIVTLNLAAVWQRDIFNPENNDIDNFIITPIKQIQNSKLINTNLIYGQMSSMIGDGNENKYAITGYPADGLYECVKDTNGTIQAFYPKGLNGNGVYVNQNIEKFNGNYYISLKDLYIDQNNFENNKDVLLKSSDKDSLLSNIKLTPSSKIPKKLTRVLLSDYGKHENTMNGLILYLNQLVDFSNAGERNFTTIKGLLNVLKDEINRVGSYSVDTVSNLNYKIGRLEAKVNEKLNMLEEIASDKDVEYAKNTINKRINRLLIGEEYGGSDDNKNYDFEEFLYPIGLDNNYSFFGNQVKTSSNIQEAFNNVYNIIGSDGSSSSGATVMSKIKELEQKIVDLNDATRKLEEKQEEEKKENEKVEFEVCESSNSAFSSIRLVENNSQYNPYTNTVFISLKLALTTNKNVDKLLSNANNGLPKGLVKLIQGSQKYNITSNEIALSSTQTGTNSRNYNARIERQWANNQGVIVLSTTHDFKSNTSYGLQINGSYLLGASGEDSSGVFITYTVNGQPYSQKITQYICPSSLRVPGDKYDSTKYTKTPFAGWYHGSEKITDSKGNFIKGTSIIDANGGFKALNSDITLEAKYGASQHVSSLDGTTWTLKKSGGTGTGYKNILSVPSFSSNNNTFTKIYVSYNKNGNLYTVTYHKKKGDKIKVYVEGSRKLSTKYHTIKFTSSAKPSEGTYKKLCGFLNHSGGTIKYK